MGLTEQRAVVSLALLAAFADGDKHERERAEIRRIAEGLSNDPALHLPTLYQDVLMGRVTLDGVAASLPERAQRQLAYEMAVCVCDADGAQSEAERQFLARARAALALDGAEAEAFTRQAEAIAEAPLATLLAQAAPAAAQPARAAPDAAELDKTILQAAILNGALELLPETLSTMAIIPLQMRLVYRLGQAHGFELDRGHIKDFLATIGVGLTSQYLEQAGRKLLGGLLGKVGGGLLGSLGRQGVSSGMSFATTYALGHVARRYYAGGRTLSTQMLKDSFADMTRQGQGLQPQYMAAIQDKARSLNPAQVMAMVRGA